MSDRSERSYAFGNSRVVVKYGDIVQSDAEVLVNSDDTELSMGGRGVGSALLAAGGPEVQKDAQKSVGKLQPGDVIVASAGDLGARYIFHAITRIKSEGPAFDEARELAIVESVLSSCFDKLRVTGLSSIAFPALGTGFAKFSVREVAANMARSLKRILVSSQESYTVTLFLLPKDAGENINFGDFLLRLDQANWAAAFGAYDGSLHCSIRTTERDVNAGEVLQHVLGSRSAGGHDQIAGGRIPLGSDPEDRERTATVVRDRLLRELGLDGEGCQLI